MLGDKTKLNAGRKKAESMGSHVAAGGDRCWNSARKPQLRGDKQINRNGLI